MSFRTNFSNANSSFSSLNASNNLENINVVPQSNAVAFRGNIRNDFSASHYNNSSTTNRYPLSSASSVGSTININRANQFHNNAPFPRPLINAPPLSHPSLVNTRPPNLINLPSQPSNSNQPYTHFHEQSYNRNVVPQGFEDSSNGNFNPRNINFQHLPPPVPNIACNNLPPNINYPRFQSNACFNSPANPPLNFSSLPQYPVSVSQNATNIINSSASYSVRNLNNFVSQSSATLQNTSTEFLQVPLHLLQSESSDSKNLNRHLNYLLLDKERKIDEFLAKFSIKKNENKHQVTIPEFRFVIKAAFRMIKQLNDRKSKFSNLLNASESEWKSQVETTLKEQEELSTLCSFISDSDHLNNVIKKLRLIKKRRERKKKTKQNKSSDKMLAEQKRKERHQEIDKWLDNIKEKNQKMKREAELKKEADFILLEVRRKIYEANRTIEKIKVFEKLRNARQANATQKGLHVLSMHNVKFEKKMSILRETMLKQLADYEAEEKALKVMLETEQEGQREEEVQWKIKKMKTLQQKKHNQIMECLFGISDDPLPTDPLYFFQKYHTSATSSIESLVQIRRQWDRHLSEDGEVIPQQWIVPVAPSNASWEQCLTNSKN